MIVRVVKHRLIIRTGKAIRSSLNCRDLAKPAKRARHLIGDVSDVNYLRTLHPGSPKDLADHALQNRLVRISHITPSFTLL